MTISPDVDRRAKAIAEHMHRAEKTSAAFDLKLVDAGKGRASASMKIRDDMVNGHGVAHGGFIFLLADTAFAWACNSTNVVTFAQNATISFLSKVEVGEVLTAEAKEDALVGRTGVYTVRVTSDDGRTVAVFQGLSRTAGGAIIEEERTSQ